MDINYIQLIMANVYVYEVIMESKAPKVFSLTRRRLPLVQLFKTWTLKIVFPNSAFTCP